MRSKSGVSLRYRLDVLSRCVAAIGGGYVLTAAITAVLALALPGHRAQATLAATMLSFAFYACAVLWAFSTRTATRAWAGVGVPALLLGTVLMLQGNGAGA